MSYDDIMSDHVGKLRRSGGLTDNGSYYRYDYITSHSELANAFLKSRNALGYPLRMQARYKDDRFIYTGDALEKDLGEALTKATQHIEKQLRDAIIHDIFPDIEACLNSVQVVNNQFTIPTARMRSSNSFASRLGKLLGKELVKTAMGFFKDQNKRKKRR